MNRILLEMLGGGQALGEAEDYTAFNTSLAKLLKRLKKDVGAKSLKQGYKGTGTQKARRQIFVTFEDGTKIDIWLDLGFVQVGGVLTLPGTRERPQFDFSDTPERTYDQLVRLLKDKLP